jgi:hypothetical protein
VAVVLLFAAVAILIAFKYSLAWYWVLILTVGGSYWPWIYDAGWLLFVRNQTLDEYIEQLEGTIRGKPANSGCLFYWCRRLLHHG